MYRDRCLGGNTARLTGASDVIGLEFVEREAIPESLMRLSIQLYAAELSLLNTVSVFEYFVSNVTVRPCTTRCRNPPYSPDQASSRTTLRSTRP